MTAATISALDNPSAAAITTGPLVGPAPHHFELRRPDQKPREARIWGPIASILWAGGSQVAMFAGMFIAIFAIAAGMKIMKAPVTSAAFEEFVQPAMIFGQFVAVAIVLLAVRLSRTRIADYLALVRPRNVDIRVILAGLLTLALPWIVMYGISPLIGVDLAHPDSTRIPESVLAISLMLFSMAIMAPVMEEMVWRGFAQRGLQRWGTAVALVLPAVIWSLSHFGDKTWLGLVEITIVGLVWGWIRHRTGSVYPTLLLHFLNNGVIVPAVAGLVYLYS